MTSALAQAGLVVVEADTYVPAGDPPDVDVSSQIEIYLPKTVVAEETTFIATVYFRLGGEATTPTTVHYRIDDLTGRQELLDWTLLNPWSEISFLISSAMNEIKDDSNSMERRQLTIKTDSGLETQVIQAVEWQIRNLQGIE